MLRMFIMWLAARQSTILRWGGIGGGSVACLLIITLVLRGEPPRELSGKSLHVAINRVLSGHTVKVKGGDRITYAGVRAPYRSEPLFEESRKRNEELVLGRRVRLRFDKHSHDKKERMSAYVYVDGVFVNETLVREGLAYVRLTPETRRFAAKLLAAQAEAQAQSRGIWKNPPAASEETYAADPKYGTVHRPSCEEAAKIRPERLVEFNDRGLAIEAGYAPCSKCRP